MHTNPLILGLIIMDLNGVLYVKSTNEELSNSASCKWKEVLSCPNSWERNDFMNRSRKERELVANFLCLPQTEDPMKSKMPKSFAEIVENAWEDWGIGEATTPEKIISENWQKIVGIQLSGKCAPDRLSVDTGVLFIRASSGPVKQELGFDKRNILQRLRKLQGCQMVKELKIS